MFGANSIVGQKYFDKAEDKLFVTSCFYTLQGEGPFRGHPAVFVRLAKCNLACGFCDTFFDDGDWLSYDELDAKIDAVIHDHFGGDVPEWMQYADHHPRQCVLVLTGGEPMLQKNLVPFLEQQSKKFQHTQIESNGTVWQPLPESTTLVVSPKCSEKRGVAIKYLEPKASVMHRANCLKFVMSADADSPYSSVPQWAHDFRANGGAVFVSPMNIYNDQPLKSKQLRATTNQISMQERSTVDEKVSFWEEGLLNMKSNQANHEYAAKYCAQHGLILNLQIHLYASMA